MVPLSLRFFVGLCAWCAAAMATGAEDSALHGCWLSQQVQVTLADHTVRDQNADCAIEYDGTYARSRCHGQGKDTEILSRYEVIGPGRLHVTQLDAATKKPKAPGTELQYRIDDRWLLIERPMMTTTASGTDDKQPVRLKSVAIRVQPKSGEISACHPRGDTHIRVGRTPVSSLALTVPTGWEPLLVDPTTEPRLGLAVNTSFLVGAFVPKGSSSSPSIPRQLVLVLDDVRYGPTPVREAEFSAVKQRFIGELGASRTLCDLPDRVCGVLERSDGAQVYTELVNVQGRVAMISGALDHASINSLSVLRKSVEVFTDQLRADNAQ